MTDSVKEWYAQYKGDSRFVCISIGIDSGKVGVFSDSDKMSEWVKRQDGNFVSSIYMIDEPNFGEELDG